MRRAVVTLAEAPIYEDARYGEVHELAGKATGLPALGLGVATVRPGATSPAHTHVRTSEVYFVTAGRGLLQLGDDIFPVSAGTCVSIAPGVVHAVTALGDSPLTFVVATSPDYDPEDDFEVEEERP